MKPFAVKPIARIKGKISFPGDKSISHRAVFLSSLCKAKTVLENFPLNKDCLSTLSVFKKLGIKINRSKDRITISGNGLYGLQKPQAPIFIAESGTTLRLLLGILAGQSFKTKIIAGRFLSKRPMLRVTQPLRLMGAKINAKRKSQNAKLEEFTPVIIEGGNLKPITYKMQIASAQVKSAIMLAALFAKGKTHILEPIPTRDHTERMLKLFKADIKLLKNEIVIKGDKGLISPGKITVPGDISSAAFFMVLAAIMPDSQVLIKNVSINPSRAGIIRVLKRMKTKIRVSLIKSRFSRQEPSGNIIVKSSSLQGITIKKEEIASLIDELPILMVAGCFARGTSVFEGVNELRVKETDRITSMVSNLKALGADIRVVRSNGLENIIVRGVKELQGGKVKSFGDHRTAMSMIVAGLAAKNKVFLDDISCINKSFPDFLKVLKSVTK